MNAKTKQEERKSDVNYTFSLNADWRFTNAPKTIPLSQVGKGQK